MMDDLISRQDAYNTLTEYYHHRTDTQHEALKEALGRVPDAHSEAFEWCTDCKEYDHEAGGCHRFEAVIRETVEELKAQQRWIPVTERMPVEYTRVIGYMAWKAMTAIEYQHGRWYSIDHLEPLPDEAVSHWMPLPQPPKEGDE